MNRFRDQQPRALRDKLEHWKTLRWDLKARLAQEDPELSPVVYYHVLAFTCTGSVYSSKHVMDGKFSTYAAASGAVRAAKSAAKTMGVHLTTRIIADQVVFSDCGEIDELLHVLDKAAEINSGALVNLETALGLDRNLK
jgi:hypothetical protein